MIGEERVEKMNVAADVQRTVLSGVCAKTWIRRMGGGGGRCLLLLEHVLSPAYDILLQ